MSHGGRSTDQIFGIGEIINAVSSIQAAMPKCALEDLTTCLHYYSDDWDAEDGGVWGDIHDDPKVIADPSTAIHRLKYGQLEDSFK